MDKKGTVKIMEKLKLAISRNTQGGYRIYEFIPSITRLFYKNMEDISFQRRIRFALELIKGYKVYYLEIRGKIVGYCVISIGGGRYSFAGKSDIVVGPYYVEKEERGNHYSELLVSELLMYDNIHYNDAYDWIKKTNIPSLKCSEAVGFEIVGTADIVKPFRRIAARNDDSGEYYILKGNRDTFARRTAASFFSGIM